ncbi:MAG TPA: hypothetical protein VIQ11_13280, partial [Mycobacterium sp.]
PATTAEAADAAATDAPAEETAETTPPTSEKADSGDAEASDSKLQNKRPAGKGSVLGRRRRTRGGVAVED